MEIETTLNDPEKTSVNKNQVENLTTTPTKQINNSRNIKGMDIEIPDHNKPKTIISPDSWTIGEK